MPAEFSEYAETVLLNILQWLTPQSLLTSFPERLLTALDLTHDTLPLAHNNLLVFLTPLFKLSKRIVTNVFPYFKKFK